MDQNSRPLTVALDFDGTLVWTEQYPFFNPEPLAGCLECLDYLKKTKNARFILLTQRDDAHIPSSLLGRAIKVNRLAKGKLTCLQEAVEWCKKNKIELWGINKNPSQANWSLSPKVYADLYIDDRCAGIPLDGNGCVDWITLNKMLHEKFNDNN